VFVLYNIPQRDLHSYSGGGAKSKEAYLQWIDAVVKGAGSREAVFILEPDAVAHAPQMSPEDRQQRFALLKEAVHRLQSAPGVSVYLDAGHPRWLGAEQAADLLRQAGVQEARGFALNVSNFVGTRENIEYGNRIGGLLDKSYLIDTSRNGLGPAPDGEVINPEGRSLGELPSVISSEPRLDANLWVKRPGESDGARAGAPAAGSWWPEFALGLVQRAPAQVALRQAITN
jgi:endoglucanase